MFGLVKQILFSAMMFFGCDISSANSLKCVSMSNKECRIRSEIININSNEPSFYPYSVKLNKCSSSCNNVNDPYAKIYIPDVVRKTNIKVFDLMSRINESRYIRFHKNL